MRPQFHQGARGRVFACSRTGAIHRRLNQNRQDACKAWFGSQKGDPDFIIAVADGHGSPQYLHSDVGATLAVKAAVGNFLLLARAQETLKSGFLKNYPGAVAKSWRENAFKHAAGQSALTAKDEPAQKPEILKYYGTTLLAAMLFKDDLYLAQLGDGAILLLNRRGEFVMPTRVESELLGQETFSLCLPDAAQRWGLAVIPLAEAQMLLLCTDGLADAFEPEAEFFRWAGDLRGIARQYPPEATAQALPKWLDDISRNSIGDDITLAAWVLREDKD